VADGCATIPSKSEKSDGIAGKVPAIGCVACSVNDGVGVTALLIKSDISL